MSDDKKLTALEEWGLIAKLVLVIPLAIMILAFGFACTLLLAMG